MNEHPEPEAPGPEGKENNLPEDRDATRKCHEAAAARIYKLKAGSGEEEDHAWQMARHGYVSVSLRGASHLPKDVSTVGKLLWEQHVPSEKNLTYQFEIPNAALGGDRILVTETPGRFRRTSTCLGRFLLEDICQVLGEDDGPAPGTTRVRIYAPDAGALRRHWESDPETK